MTDIHKLWDYREYINLEGLMLTPELITRVENTLTELQTENHFNCMQYFGRIYAINDDYHIACGFNKEALHERKYFYSTDFTFWGILPKPLNKHKDLALLATYPFRGDPALKIKVLDEALHEEDPERCQIIKEEDRLAATVNTICEEVEIAARGRYIKDFDGTIRINENFTGITPLEATQLQNFYHIREPVHRWNTNLLTRKDYNYSYDFLDSIDQDIPKGCWNISLERYNTIVYLKSLYWPGMSYFHVVKTPYAPSSSYGGFLYIGNGLKSLDVPFLL